MVKTATVHLDKVAEEHQPITAEVAVHLGTTAETAEIREPWASEEMEHKILVTISDQEAAVAAENMEAAVAEAIAMPLEVLAVEAVEADQV